MKQIEEQKTASEAIDSGAPYCYSCYDSKGQHRTASRSVFKLHFFYIDLPGLIFLLR